MSFQPAIPLAGIAGWRFLERTQARSRRPSRRAPELTARHRLLRGEDRLASTTAADLVADRRLLKVALGAFGLEGEIDKKAFIRKVLEEGTTDPDAFANRLTDPAWHKLADGLRLRRRRRRADRRGRLRREDRRRLQDPRLRGGGRRGRQQHAAGDELPPRDRRRSPPGREGGELVRGARLQAAARGLREGLRPADGVRPDRHRPAARHPARQDRARSSAPTRSPPSRIRRRWRR